MTEKSYDQYTAPFIPEDIPLLYIDWAWLINPEHLSRPWLMSCFGDLFFKGPNDAIYFLDTLEGTIGPFANNEEEASELLEKPEHQKRFLTSETVDLLSERGIIRNEDELYVYVPHPVVVGGVDVNSIQVMSMKVVLSLYGQQLRQMGQH